MEGFNTLYFQQTLENKQIECQENSTSQGLTGLQKTTLYTNILININHLTNSVAPSDMHLYLHPYDLSVIGEGDCVF